MEGSSAADGPTQALVQWVCAALGHALIEGRGQAATAEEATMHMPAEVEDPGDDDLPMPASPMYGAQLRTERAATAGDLAGSYQAPALARTLTSKMNSLASLFPEQHTPRGGNMGARLKVGLQLIAHSGRCCVRACRTVTGRCAPHHRCGGWWRARREDTWRQSSRLDLAILSCPGFNR